MTTTMNAPFGAAWRNAARRAAPWLCTALLWMPQAAAAQDRGSVNPEPLPPLAKPDDPATPAKELFGRKTAPAPLEARTIGFYAKGCLAGAMALPINGKTWQVMRLSRNRNWGHPNLVQFLERLADKAPKTGWHGLLVGDMSQPRGGPMLTGHASHQVGLDADIWLTPMPDRELTREEREEMSATMVVAEDRKDVDPKVWTPAHLNVIKAAAKDPQVDRIFVNAAIKKALVPRGRQRPPLAQQGAAVVGARLSFPRSAHLSRPTIPNASRSRRGRPTRAAARSSTTGSPTRSCTPSRRRRRRSRGPGRAWPTCRPPAASAAGAVGRSSIAARFWLRHGISTWSFRTNR